MASFFLCSCINLIRSETAGAGGGKRGTDPPLFSHFVGAALRSPSPAARGRKGSVRFSFPNLEVGLLCGLDTINS